MPLFSDDFLNYLLANGERELSISIPSIFYRESIAVTQGTSVYTLPTGIIRILRVTWKGEKVFSWEHADSRPGTWMKPQNLANQGKPKFYLSYEYGYTQIKFHPVPNETIAADDTKLDSAPEDIVTIVGYKVADPSSTYRIPEYIRRRTNKYYAMHRAYAREGKTQDIKAADYFKKKFDFVHAEFASALKRIPVVDPALGPVTLDNRNRPARPVLPSSGKWAI